MTWRCRWARLGLPRPSVEAICRAHGLSRQAFYQGRHRQRARQRREVEALEAVQRERALQPRLGTRKLYALYRPTFRRLKIGRDALFELLGRASLLVEPRRRRAGHASWRHDLAVHPNLAQTLTPERPNELWVADMTYLPVAGGYAYASLVTDAYSRKIVGYHLAPTLAAEGPLAALREALEAARRRGVPLGGLIHHSDRGSQYCCQAYVSLLERHGCRVSMTGGGVPQENAVAERLNGTLKHEYLLGAGFRTLAEARRALAEAVRLYNERRPHLSLDYARPAEVHGGGLLSTA